MSGEYLKSWNLNSFVKQAEAEDLGIAEGESSWSWYRSIVDCFCILSETPNADLQATIDNNL